MFFIMTLLLRRNRLAYTQNTSSKTATTNTNNNNLQINNLTNNLATI